MPPLSKIDEKLRDRLLSVVHQSLFINRHVEFFRWLQDEVHAFLPHDVLIAAWGNFATGELAYDIASNIPEIRTEKVSIPGDVALLVRDLYFRWQNFGCECFALNHFEWMQEQEKPVRENSTVNLFCSMNSILVHGIRDKRSQSDCLYIFFSSETSASMDQSVMSLLLPHIDAALRRVECLPMIVPPEVPEVSDQVLHGFSPRENEIMTWLEKGKTNEEIGMILGISAHTVKNHMKNIFKKLDVSTRTQAVSRYRAGS